jgi:hypothetical protein
MKTPNTMPRAVPARQLRLPEDAPLENLPRRWIREITRIRRENAKTRIELRDARAELSVAQQRIAALMLDNADLRDGIPAR